jgi:hypothetical protein
VRLCCYHGAADDRVEVCADFVRSVVVTEEVKVHAEVIGRRKMCRLYGDVCRLYGDVCRLYGDVCRLYGDVCLLCCKVCSIYKSWRECCAVIATSVQWRSKASADCGEERRRPAE